MNKLILFSMILIGLICITGCNENNYDNIANGKLYSPENIQEMVDNGTIRQVAVPNSDGTTSTINLIRTYPENRLMKREVCWSGPDKKIFAETPVGEGHSVEEMMQEEYGR